MEDADFSGYATKAGLKCSDGLTINAGAFKHQTGITVPLMWQHQHSDTENVLGHAVLESRDDGVYAYGFFNDTPAGERARSLVKHGDVKALSIYANRLVKKAQEVLHGFIGEVSLVLAGANPGAYIESVNLRHADGSEEELENEAIIYTGLTFEHAVGDDDDSDNDDQEDTNVADEEKTVGDVFNSLTEEQQNVVYYMINEAVKGADEVEQSADDNSDSDDTDNSDKSDDSINHQEGDNMSRNVFEDSDKSTSDKTTLSHSEIQTILTDAQKSGSLKEAVLKHAGTYGIDNIDVLFPDAKTVNSSPEMISRRMEWVDGVINGTRHTPFARIKSTAADITADEARAKGYIKGNMKKDEVIKLLKRVTGPQTIYKKQKLDRDDIIDITDLDVVAWLKAEMRVMLEEELARAILLGDGRDVEDDDKINEENIRPIATDDDLYAHKVSITLSDENSSGEEIVEAVLRNLEYYKGSGTPSFYTTQRIITKMLLSKDQMGRRLYKTKAELTDALSVSKLVAVEAMESHGDLVGLLVNLSDYTVGADKGGNISMFDDFDIDYNQYKYLLETRVSGALTKPKSALVITRGSADLVTPADPTFDTATDTITIPTTANVEYLIDGAVVTGSVVIEEITEVRARALDGYAIDPAATSSWIFDPAA